MKQIKFRIIFIAIAILSSQQFLFSQTPADEKEIRAVFNKMNEAWAAHDYGYTAYDILDDSAILINPVGMLWRNKTEIVKGLQYLGEVRFKYYKPVEGGIVSIRFLSPTVALVVAQGIDEVAQDFTMPGEATVTKKGERSEGWQTYTLIKGNGSWKITSITITHVVK